MDGICFKLWKFVFSFVLVDTTSPYKLGFGANFQLKKHWKMEGFSTSVARRAVGELLLNVGFLHVGEELYH